MEGQVLKISKDENLEVTGKIQPFTLLKHLINNKYRTSFWQIYTISTKWYNHNTNEYITKTKMNMIHQM